MTNNYIEVPIKILNKSHYPLPRRESKGASGFDLKADIQIPIELDQFQIELIPTGIYVEIPEGYEGQVRARSGLALKHGITLVNGIGTIDSDYRGEIKAIIINLGKEPYTIYPGDRIAQLVFTPIVIPSLELVYSFNELSETFRDSGGFGSSGF